MGGLRVPVQGGSAVLGGSSSNMGALTASWGVLSTNMGSLLFLDPSPPQLHQQQQQQPQGPGPQPAGGWVAAGAPKHPFVTTGEHRPRGVSRGLGGHC